MLSRFLSLLFIVLSLQATAQQPAKELKGTITGHITDSVSGKPLEYAVVTLFQEGNKKALSGATSNNKGDFTISKLGPGVYKISFEFIGYTSRQSGSITVNNGVVSLGNIKLMSTTSQNLQEVTVVSKAPITENKIDKTVYNVANDITSQGGVALDVLKKVPQVTVDIDGNVELQGNSNIRFLINGKPSSMFGNSLADALASIPASQIKSIEAITSPGAKYDAQGTGGIINIVLKDNKLQGINGNINLSAGTRLENGSVNLNIRHNNFGMNVFFSGNAQLSSHTPNSQDRLSSDTSAKTTTHLLQDGYTDFTRNGYQSGVGLDWGITKKDNITASFSYNHFNNQSIAFVNQEQLTQNTTAVPLTDVYSFRNSNSRFHNNNFDWNINYKKKFKKEGQELEILYDDSYGKPNSNYIQSQTYKGQPSPYTGSSSNNPGTNRETEIAADYAHPVNDNFLIETGVKTVFQNINSIAAVNTYNANTNQYTPDTTQSYQLNYHMKVYAGYLSATFPLFHFLDVKAGVRYEYTHVTIDFSNTSIPSYGNLVPSLILSHKFSREQFVKLAYSHRIERADYGDLNPFLNLSDPYNITTGNPVLKPEIGHNIELGYSKPVGKGGNIYIALIERINTDDHKPVTTFYPTFQIGDSVYQNVSITNQQNAGTEYNSGITISGSVPVTKKLNIRSNILLMQRNMVTHIAQGNNVVSTRFRLNLNATYQLPHNLVVEAFGNYFSPSASIQGKQPQSITYTFAFRKQFWNKNASIGFTATNPFNTYIKQVTTIVTTGYNAYNVREVPYRSFGISFTYKFGKLEFKKSKEDDNNYLNNPPTMGN